MTPRRRPFRFSSGGERAERRLGQRRVIEPDQAGERDGPVGECASLSRHTTSTRPAPPRRKLPNQYPAPGERDRGRAEGDAGQQDQPGTMPTSAATVR